MARSLPALALMGLVHLYRSTVSPFLGVNCRYQPSCSRYGLDALAGHGAWKGGWMLAARLCRCHPWGGAGYDPVPDQARRAPWYAPWKHGVWRCEPLVKGSQSTQD